MSLELMSHHGQNRRRSLRASARGLEGKVHDKQDREVQHTGVLLACAGDMLGCRVSLSKKH